MGMCLMRWSVPVHGTHTDTWNDGNDRRKDMETCLFRQWSVTKRNGRPAGHGPAGRPFVYIYFIYSLSQNRIREQYLVIDLSVHLHGCLRHHELYAFPLHLRLLHEPVHNESGGESRAPFVLPYDEPVIIGGTADIPVSRIVIMCETYPASAKDPPVRLTWFLTDRQFPCCPD